MEKDNMIEQNCKCPLCGNRFWSDMSIGLCEDCKNLVFNDTKANKHEAEK